MDGRDKEKNQDTKMDYGRGELHKMNRNTARGEKHRNWSFKFNLFCSLRALYHSARLKIGHNIQGITSSAGKVTFEM